MIRLALFPSDSIKWAYQRVLLGFAYASASLRGFCSNGG